ncbi:hypothetical protein P154DRAFT_439444 [Amniculicola lignicola CBS 123094]|uniref:Formin GTPase-binding domain-containing protein n=1 Tax=Amniculicola lignicola CBS 123094 TaxID=1392246 RepID=A0A6A5W9B1_9PLEO|nr:hypothetical protein P154DRAFT_439444 [Amniculicola lignicola CBS 123094]
MASTTANVDRPGHRRNKSSTSVLKSIIVPKSHKRSPSDGTALSKNQPDLRPYNPLPNIPQNAPLLPPDHPHNQLRAPRPQSQVVCPPSPRKSQDTKDRPSKSLHKKTLSSLSLRSLSKEKNTEKIKETQSRDLSRTPGDTSRPEAPVKTKSSTNLAAMFNRVKSPKEGKQVSTRDKENSTPPSSADAAAPAQTPIWAQFSSQAFEEVTNTTKVPLNDRHSIDEEINLYTPTDYSPSKQRNFYEYGQPVLAKKQPAKERPKSTIMPASTSTSMFDNFTRKRSDDRVPLGDTKTKGNAEKPRVATQPTNSSRHMLRRSSSDSGKKKDSAAKQAASPTKKPNRVMAAVAALNGKARHANTASTSPTKMDPKSVEADFEAVLESRNIPPHQRAQMRTLKLEVKADFVRMHKLDTPVSSRVTSAQSTVGEAAGKKSTKSTLGRSSKSRDGSIDDDAALQTSGTVGSTKRERPRSRAFTFSKADSPTKKQKADAHDRKTSSKSNPIPKSPSTRSLVSNSSQRSASQGAKTTSPTEFVIYLQKTTAPQKVEVGKLHKLRLLLRNETVDWVDAFMQEGGMMALVGLLHRIMEVEWREDHEDTLLHEVLRCLKGLTTADSALKQLAELAPTLFPALLAMLFDEEHKGPSDFTTRELIVQLLFAHLSAATDDDIHARTAELLKYLKDPVKEKESSTVPFILQMHQPRPYQVWCREITNVTKEVFWIFIHHLNIVPITTIADGESQTYAKAYFPGPRAIVPAAPYVGGVEWDATNYIATHLDLVNGILASLPTTSARNALRSELKVSGFEKLMGQLRTCNPKYYGAVHDAMKLWVAAGIEDGWDIKPVRMGAGDGKTPGSPVKSPQKSPKKAEPAPQIKAPKMDLGLGLGLDLGFEKEIGGRVAKRVDDDWI